MQRKQVIEGKYPVHVTFFIGYESFIIFRIGGIAYIYSDFINY